MCSALVGNIGTNAVSKHFAVLQIKPGLLAGEKRTIFPYLLWLLNMMKLGGIKFLQQLSKIFQI